MRQNNYIRRLAVTAALASCAGLATGGENARRPNILFLMTDQQRWDCGAANGNKLIKTPPGIENCHREAFVSSS